MPIGVCANTEKVIFTARHGLASASASATVLDTSESGATKETTLDPTQWKRLSSPHTILRAENLLPSFYENDVTLAALRKQETQASSRSSQDSSKQETGTRAEKGVGAGALLEALAGGNVDLQNREFKWYILEDLEDGASFELRVSYPATSPADFDMVVWTLDEAQAHLPKNIQLRDHFSENTMFARIKATYTGVSYRSDGVSSGPETLPVPYNLVLERLYLMIPYQALKLAVVIAVVAVVGLGYIVPTIHSALLRVANEGSAANSQKEK
ncbi:hypothetical protein BGZ99_006384 [Dissophora globulifera]|uniref:Uncharacterized protein n=1 Tax=Dissophora globulifera TaxID=979702 RepID=A0A9P6RS77_9FUNG|nr:hypothetical protein BGZ99_006384 [Dissophora globulifera]